MRGPEPTSDPDDPADWSFVVRPRWLLSHAFALGLMALFVVAGFWQLRRLDERQQTNAVVEERAGVAPVSVAEAVVTLSPGVSVAEAGAQLDYVVVADHGRYLDDAAVRVANRSQNGAAGDWIVGLFETDDGALVLVNRGFLPRDVEPASPPEPDRIQGWLRPSHEKGPLGPTDTGEGLRSPRLDVEVIADRLGLRGELAPVWVQLDGPAASFGDDPTIPAPVPLPPLDDGPHLSYALQWFTFTLMSVVMYGLVLRRQARRPAVSDPADDRG